MPPLLIEKLLDLSFSSIKPIEAFLPLPNSLLFVIGRKEGARRNERREEEKLRKEEGGRMNEEIEDNEEDKLGEKERNFEVEERKEEEGKGREGRREGGGGRGGREGGGGRMEGGGMSRFQLFCEVWDLKNFTIVSEMMLDAYGVKYLCDFAIYENNVIMNVKSTFGIKKIFFLDVLTKKRWSSKIELRKKIRKVNMNEDNRNENEGEEGKKNEELGGGEVKVISEVGQGREEEEVKKKGKKVAVGLVGEGTKIERGVLVRNDDEKEEIKDLREEDGIINEKLEEREEKERFEGPEDIGSEAKEEGMEEVLKSGIFRVKLGKIVYYEVISMVKPMIFQNSFDCYTLIILEVYSDDASKLDLQLKFRRSAIKKEQTSLISILKEGDFILIWDGLSNEITIWDLLHPSDLYYFSANFSGIKPIKLFFPQRTLNHPPPACVPPPPASINFPLSSIFISSSPLLVCLLVKEQPTNLIKVLTLNLKENTILSKNIMKIEEILDPGEYLDVYKVKILLFKKTGNQNPDPSLFPFPPSYYSETELSQLIEEGLNKGEDGGGKEQHPYSKEGEGWRRMRMSADSRENGREEKKNGKKEKEDEGMRRNDKKEDERKEEEERRLYLLIMLQMRGKLEYLKYFLYFMEENEENDFKFVWKCQKENQINYGFEAKEEFTVCRTEGGDGGLYLRIFFLNE